MARTEIETPPPILWNESLTFEGFLQGMSEDRPLHIALTMPPQNFIDAETRIREAEILTESEWGLERVAKNWSACSVYDLVELSTTFTIGKDTHVTVKTAETREGLDNAPAFDLPNDMQFQQRQGLRGTIWPGEEKGQIIFRTPLRTQLFLNAFGDMSEAEQKEFIVSIVLRNFRIKTPLFAFPCPNCGRIFLPKRRGQLYHTKSCAHKAGERRRYASRKSLRKEDSTG